VLGEAEEGFFPGFAETPGFWKKGRYRLRKWLLCYVFGRVKHFSKDSFF
jgi:hypothetical protein